MNILLTCAGRRNYLVRFFQQSLDGAGQVLACDASDIAPALRDADRAFVIPAADHPGYADELARLCEEHDVGLLIPIHDFELAPIAEQAARLRAVGAIAVISSPRVIEICQDKLASYRFLRKHRLPTPLTFSTIAETRQALARGLVDYPLIMKPRWGVSSIGIAKIENERELALTAEWGQLQLQRTMLSRLCRTTPDRGLVFQKYLEGQEYGMDVVNDLDGRYAATFVRRKLVMRGGNTDRALTVRHPRFERLGRALGEQIGHLGCLDVDLMETDAGCFILDLNPRFGGGYPFSHLAGANLPAALLAWAAGGVPEPAWLRPASGIVISMYDDLSIVKSKALPSAQLPLAATGSRSG